MIRTLALAGGLAGAATFAQYPEFSQQYLQRLAGQVDALEIVVADFEASAMRAGLTRSQALAELTGTPFLLDRQGDMRRTFRRHAVLSDNLATLRAATPLQRIVMPHRIADLSIFTATWSDYKPAMPLTFAGILSGSVGLAMGWALIRLLWIVISAPLRSHLPRRKQYDGQPGRTEPAVQRYAPPPPGPRLAGARRD